MKWTTGQSRQHAFDEALAEAANMLDVGSVGDLDVALVFFSSHHAAHADAAAREMDRLFPDAVCLGIHAAGVVGAREEAEDEPFVSVTAACLPGVAVTPLRFEPDVHDRPDFDWAAHPGLVDIDQPHFVILSDPQSFETQVLLEGLDQSYSSTEKFGGLFGGGDDQNTMIVDGQVYESGAVGLALSGPLEVETMVAQACRPIGEPLIVTRHSQNIIHQFDRGNPMAVFRNIVSRLDDDDRELAQHSMFVGIGVDNARGEYDQGDFLIRDIVGFNPKTGDLAVAAPIEDLQVLQFHLMDATTSAMEFERALDEYQHRHSDEAGPAGALLFACADRGSQLSGYTNHESEVLAERFPGVAVGGCFCHGEIGRAGAKTAMHGYASALTVFREPTE